MENNLGDSKETTQESTEQKVDTASLEARIKELENENGRLKQAQSSASADASKHKHRAEDLQKQLDAKLSDEEKAKRDQEAAYAAMQEKLTALEAERDVANFTAVLSASDIGMDADTAKAVAEALHSGETEKVFDGIRKFILAHDKAMTEKAMLNNPTLPGGNSTKTITKDEFMNMGLEQMQAFHDEHPDLYAEYMNKT